MLETDYLLFRGDFRVKIPFASMQSVKARGDWLEIASPEGTLMLQLGPRAGRWEQKILHPPSRLDKLGVKPGSRALITGARDAQLRREIAERGATLVTKDADLVFYNIAAKTGLNRVASVSRLIQPDGAVWIIYPKGVREVTETDVIAAIRAAGMKDVKVASFSATHTALKAVIPLAQRAAR
ncbi:MAG TPA: hypothetical protein VMG40_01995 [Bryobacteraceae bacterium]|nr:hypothetical protein [Bryobacteraceae bacterium]